MMSILDHMMSCLLEKNFNLCALISFLAYRKKEGTLFFELVCAIFVGCFWFGGSKCFRLYLDALNFHPWLLVCSRIYCKQPPYEFFIGCLMLRGSIAQRLYLECLKSHHCLLLMQFIYLFVGVHAYEDLDPYYGHAPLCVTFFQTSMWL